MSAEGLRRPESVLVVIHTPERQCLVLERVDPPGFWQSVTGTLRWGETHAEAARREVMEETGLVPRELIDADTTREFAILPAWRARYAPEVTANLEHWWYLRVPEAVEVRLNPAEHRRYDWLTLEQAIARVSSWTNREALERLRAP
jgi:dATP pyrophosphohydrolase